MNNNARRQYLLDYLREYNQLPEVKKRKRFYGQRPDVKEHQRLYRQRPEVKKHLQLYRRLPASKMRQTIYRKRYRRQPGVMKRIRHRIYEYRQHPHTKLLRSGYASRHKSKGFTPLCPNDWSCPVDYHHISATHPYVVPLPRAIHRAVGGRRHYIFNVAMVCFLYGLHPS